MINVFVNNPIPEAIKAAFGNGYTTTPMKVHPIDDIYGYLKQAGSDPIEEMFVAVSNLDKAATPVGVELDFLRALGLLMERDNALYIHSLAEIFYGPEGYFANPGVGAQQAVIKLLYNYTLPGRYWTTHRLRRLLPDDVQPAVALESHKRDIAELLLELVDHK
jgi:hypothetical protein